MNAAVTHPHTETFLPEIPPNRKKRRKGSYYRLEEPLKAGLVSEYSTHIPSIAEISKFRNSLKQNICVEILLEGFHRTFSELFYLLNSDRDRRESAEPGTDLARQTPLEEQKDKLETMRRHLSRAEQAERTRSWTVVCEQRLFLGRYFSSQEDLWLRLHFCHSCADREYGGRSRSATEARVHLAEHYLQTGELEQAQQQAEICIQQAEGGDWLDSDGQPLKLRGAKALWRIYLKIADPLLDAEEYRKALALLHIGYDEVLKTEDKQLEAEAAYGLGLTNQRAGDHKRAKQFFNTCMQIYSTLEDAEGLVKSYMAMAKSLQSEGNIDETVQWLEKSADVSLSSGQQHRLVDAYLRLGKIYNERSQSTRAYEFFLQGYEVACDVGDVSLLDQIQVRCSSMIVTALFQIFSVNFGPFVSQVIVGTLRAHRLMEKYSADIRSATPTALQRLLTWKDTRQPQDFSADDSDSAMD
ncbi:tetratricopeptide repeat protein 29 isoform X2 [Xyrichtys novacula]|uniref:Tetratricopeptide repeat protein 29 n=1 Tax=Xyrichtys novacula TaxID=13765 RepID=A0AAV1HN63_XYRNO|nr:tetratricopeptide repeat protein 29 isoform X2 [Xyrichtys novacula]